MVKVVGLDLTFLRAVVQQESGGRPDALRAVGATGLMQVMPATFEADRQDSRRAPVGLVDARLSVHEMRLFKSPAELDVQRRAADITALAHVAAMQAARPGVHEYEIEGPSR